MLDVQRWDVCWTEGSSIAYNGRCLDLNDMRGMRDEQFGDFLPIVRERILYQVEADIKT